MADKFFKQSSCDRCGKSLAEGRTMSRFNTDCICLKCAAEERKHPDYRKAVEAELNAIRHGDYNFPGIGWPGKNTQG